MNKLTFDSFFINENHIFSEYANMKLIMTNDLFNLINKLNVFERYIFLYRNKYYEVYIKNTFNICIQVSEIKNDL